MSTNLREAPDSLWEQAAAFASQLEYEPGSSDWWKALRDGMRAALAEPAQEMTDELRRAWEALPDAMKAHPGIKTLHRAADSASRLPAVTECNDNDSPWLVCKTCAARGLCIKSLPEMGEGDWPELPPPVGWYYGDLVYVFRGDAVKQARADGYGDEVAAMVQSVHPIDQLRTAMRAAVEAYKALVRGKT